jgi:hypothetical protein
MRRAVMKLLDDAEWSHWSDREIAKHAKVHHDLVGRLRPTQDTGGNASMETGAESETRTFTHHKTGKPTKMKTGKIGKGQMLNLTLPLDSSRPASVPMRPSGLGSL